MAKKIQGFLDWLYSHGVVIAYGVIITVTLAVLGAVMLGVVLAVAWWERIR